MIIGNNSVCVFLVHLVIIGYSCLGIANAQSDDIDDTNTISVLLIGNSYTYRNDLPGLLSRISANANSSVTIETAHHTRGGYNLGQHWYEGQAVSRIREDWDFVVLQEYSTRPINYPATMREFARKFDEEIKASGAQTIFYMTWARQYDPGMIEELAQVYTDIAIELGARLAPVGRAWEKSLKERPDLILHTEDQSHPNVHGSYLAACVFYTVLTGKSPLGLSNGGLNQISDEEAEFLQRIAFDSVEEYAPDVLLPAVSIQGSLIAMWGDIKQ